MTDAAGLAMKITARAISLSLAIRLVGFSARACANSSGLCCSMFSQTPAENRCCRETDCWRVLPQNASSVHGLGVVPGWILRMGATPPNVNAYWSRSGRNSIMAGVGGGPEACPVSW